MNLSYEETMRRIDECEKRYVEKGLKRTFCREIKYPYHVHLYYGEKQIVVVPLTTAMAWFTVEMAWYRQITDLQNAKLIGKTIFEAFEHIKNSPVDARTEQERSDDSFMKHAVSYKSYTAFNRNYLLCGVILHEDGRIVVSQTRKLDNNKGFECDWAGQDNKYITNSVNGTISYDESLGCSKISVKFTKEDNCMLTPDTILDVHFRVHTINWDKYDLSNDFSFHPELEYTENSKMLIYYNGELVNDSAT